MLDYRLRHTGWSSWLRRHRRTLDLVTEAIRTSGPAGSADFEHRRPAGRGGWWSWKPAQHALHYLWMTGALAVHSRPHFQKRYDLSERILSAWPDVEPLHDGGVPGVARRAVAPRNGRRRPTPISPAT